MSQMEADDLNVVGLPVKGCRRGGHLSLWLRRRCSLGRRPLSRSSDRPPGGRCRSCPPASGRRGGVDGILVVVISPKAQHDPQESDVVTADLQSRQSRVGGVVTVEPQESDVVTADLQEGGVGGLLSPN